MAPFQNEFSKMEFIEDIFDFAISAWNFGNISTIMDEEEFKNIINSEQEVDTGLLNKMIKYKVANYKEYTNYIVDYELKETSGDPKLVVITQEEDTYLASMLNVFEGQNSRDDFEENYINRNAIVIKPLQPFINWHNALYPDGTINTSDINESNIYLINDNIDNLEVWLKKKFDKFFMLELEDWHTNKKEWPQKRNYKMFKQWFNIEISTLIYDLEKEPVSKSE